MGQTTTLIKHQPASNAGPAPTPQMVIDTLNNLVQSCADGAFGFAVCADYTNISRHRSLFRQRAHDCDAAGARLQTVISRLGGRPTAVTSTGGRLHRGWVAMPGTLSGLRDQSILAECERGASIALAEYLAALAQNLPSDIQALVHQQCVGVQSNLSQMQTLRQPEKAAA